MDLEMHDGTILQVDDATPPEVRQKIVKNWLAKNPPPAAPLPPGMKPIPAPADTIGPTNRRIYHPTGLSETLQAAGSAVPGMDYAQGAVGWLQDRLPEALGGVPAGRERTYREALDDQRAERGEATRTDPLAQVAGETATVMALPWAKGAGAGATGLRALQAGGLRGTQSVTQGDPLEEAAIKARDAALTALGLETGLSYGPQAYNWGRNRIKALVDRWTNRQAFAGAGASSAQDVAAAASTLPEGQRADQAFGQFTRDAKLENGAPVLARGDDPYVVGQKAKQLVEEAGARKGALDAEITRRGITPDSKSLLDALEAEVAPLTAPEFVGAYGREPAIEVMRTVRRIRKAMGLPPSPTIEERWTGWVTEDAPAFAGEPPATGVKVAPEVRTSPPPRELPPESSARDLQKQVRAPTYEQEPGTIIRPTGEVDRPTMIYKPQHPRADKNGFVDSRDYYRDRNYEPPPEKRLYPVLRDVEEPVPKTFAEWEKLKSNLQQYLFESAQKYGKLSDKITGPAQETMRRIQSVIRQADEDLVKAKAPDLYDAFIKAKDEFGKASVLKPMAVAAGERSMIPASADRARWEAEILMRRLLPIAAGAGAGASQGVKGAILGGLGGWGAGSLAKVAAESHPTMTRAGDAVSRFLAKEMPGVPVDEAFAAKLATLLRSGG